MSYQGHGHGIVGGIEITPSSGTPITVIPPATGDSSARVSSKRPKLWHNNSDLIRDMRLKVTESIMALLRERKPDANAEKIPRMAKQLEEYLYYEANSLEDYNDSNTLKKRLTDIVRRMNPNGASRNVAAPTVVVKPETTIVNRESGPPMSVIMPQTSVDIKNSMEHKRQIINQQQQRLLQLRHASKCPYEPGTCPDKSMDCENMKGVWNHIHSCKDSKCDRRHCCSSIYVLTHYTNCKDETCVICGPVRMASKVSTDGKRTLSASYETSSKKYKNGSTSAAALQHLKAQQVAQEHALDAAAIAKRRNALLDPISCPLYSFPNEQIYAHIKGIRDSFRNVYELCHPPLEEILKMPHCNDIFGRPVDPVALELPDYFDIIKQPMDLGTIKKKLEDKQYSYRDVESFVSDVHLVFNNAIEYNPDDSEVYDLAVKLLNEFDKKMNNILALYDKKVELNRHKKDLNCFICGEGDLHYEQQVFHCNGRHCNGSRIRKNTTFYAAPNQSYHWCTSCYNELKDNQAIKLADCTLHKNELIKSKFEPSLESFVQCDLCNGWIHHVCGLFNNRRNFSERDVPYVCPYCLIEKRKAVGGKIDAVLITSLTTKKTRAVDLPHNTLSTFLERRVYECLEAQYHKTAAALGIPYDKVEKCSGLSLRCVLSYEKPHYVRENMYKRYKSKGYPDNFPCKVKCIVLFQNVDGVDVILLGMYVYEYGHKCPNPNQRRVYISYLDSVFYFRPRQYRTMIYHEILVSYLEYMKRRGFHTCHIWACPPAKGDDYILYVHPNDQKTPKEDKLRKWYQDMLDKCVDRGIVTEITNLYTEFMENPANDATVIPYFEGDYFVSEIETIIKDCEQGKADDTSQEAGSSKRKKQGRPPVTGKKVKGADGEVSAITDPVMLKFSNSIKPYQTLFFVARLHPKEYAERMHLLREQEILQEKEAGSSSSSMLKADSSTELEKEDVVVPSVHAPIAVDNSAVEENEDKAGGSTDAVLCQETGSSEPLNLSSSFIDSIITKDDTEDVDESIESPHWDSRQSFLDLCRINSYQFDQLRRAKLTSMMVLYHMHNPDAPARPYTCAHPTCQKDILQGFRINCPTCEIDFCVNCYRKYGSSVHPKHQLKQLPISGDGGLPQQLTEEQRRERQRNLQLHLQLLLHSSSCIGTECNVRSCKKMKEYIDHFHSCKDSVAKRCPTCSKLNAILQIHARHCRVDDCKVPKCGEIKENLKKLAIRQAAMDSRRCATMTHNNDRDDDD